MSPSCQKNEFLLKLQTVTILLTHRHFGPHFLRDETHFSPPPLLPTPPPPPRQCCVSFSPVCHYNPTTSDGGTGVNGTECSKWKEKSVKYGTKTVFWYTMCQLFLSPIVAASTSTRLLCPLLNYRVCSLV